MVESLPPFLQVRGTPEQMLTALAIIVFGGTAALTLLLKLLGAHRPGMPAVIAVVAAFILSPFGWSSLLIATLPFLLGFTAGRSTDVPVHPLELFERTKLHPVDYSRHQEDLLRMVRSREFAAMIESPRVHPVEKLNLGMQILFAHLYRRAPITALILSLPYIWLWAQASQDAEKPVALGGLLLLLSLPYGTAIGRLVTYIQGHPPIALGGVTLVPTLRSFLTALVWSISPAVSVILVFWFLPPERTQSLLMRVPPAIMLLLAAVLVLQDIFVHRTKLVLFEDGIAIWTRSRAQGCRWEDLRHVTIRERANRLSGTDRLLVFECNDGRKFAYPISILSAVDQNQVLILVRRNAQTETILDTSVL